MNSAQASMIGDPSYTRKFRGTVVLKPNKDGSPVTKRVRIGPPFGKLARQGVFIVLQKQHWGYSVPDKVNPDKLNNRTFNCVEKMDFRTRMVTQACAECNNIEAQKAKKDQIWAEKKAKGMADKQIEEFVAPISKWLRQHNLDCKWVMNAITPEGDVIQFAIPYSYYSPYMGNGAKPRKLNLVLAEAIAKHKVDAIAVNGGVWLDFSRIGNDIAGLDVVLAKESQVFNGIAAEVIKRAPMTDELIERYIEEAKDLTTLGRSLTPAQIEALVKTGGDPVQVEAIFGASQEDVPDEAEAVSDSPAAIQPPAVQTNESITPAVPSEAPDAAATVPLPVVSQVTAATSAPAPAVPAVKAEEVDPDVLRLTAQLEEARKRGAAARAKTPAASPMKPGEFKQLFPDPNTTAAK